MSRVFAVAAAANDHDDHDDDDDSDNGDDDDDCDNVDDDDGDGRRDGQTAGRDGGGIQESPGEQPEGDGGDGQDV